MKQLQYEQAHRQHAHDTAEELRKAYNGFIYDLTADITAEDWTEDDYLPLCNAPRFEARYKAKEKAFVKRLLSIYLGAMAVASLRAERKNASQRGWKNSRFSSTATQKAPKENLRFTIPNAQFPKRLATAKVGGLSLSERVWKNSKQTRAMIEASLNVGIKQGMSREAMARSIIKHLQHPDTLHSLVGKRYRGKVPMQVLQHFHPGQGVYRDPYKNAYRLAISEVNNAYRRRDYELGQQNPYLIGWKIQRSEGRRATTCDLCKDLEGVYPKSFLFQGWHPACLCFAIQVLKGDTDFIIEKKFDNGGKVEVHTLVNPKDNDYQKLVNIAEEFAKQGRQVKLLPKMTRPPKFKYEVIYKDLMNTKYENKCPDFLIDGKFYEHEGFNTSNPKRAFSNMIGHGLKQTDRIIIDRPNLTDAYMKRVIRQRIAEGQDISEVWLLDNEKIVNLYKKFEE